MGRSRGGLTSKIHAVVDTNGLPVHLALTPGEAHDNRLCSVLLSALLPQTMLLADRGYDANWIRELARQQGAWANIPPKRNRKDPICFSPYLYRARNLIERFLNKIKQCRRVATRYDKLAANYLAFVKLASIRIWLRANESTPYKVCHDARCVVLEAGSLGWLKNKITSRVVKLHVSLDCHHCGSSLFALIVECEVNWHWNLDLVNHVKQYVL